VPKAISTRPRPAGIRRQQKAATEDQLRKALKSLTEQGLEISISAVAVEAGYTPSLIHNSYRAFADEIRTAAGRTLSSQLDNTKQELRETAAKNAQLKAENAALEVEVTNLASENEALRRELIVQMAVATGKVSKLHP